SLPLHLLLFNDTLNNSNVSKPPPLSLLYILDRQARIGTSQISFSQLLFLLSQPFFMPPSTISALVGLGRLLRITPIPTFFSLQVITSLPLHPIVFSSDALASPAVIAEQHSLMILDQFECFFEGLLDADANNSCVCCVLMLKLLSGEEKDPHSVTTKRLWEEESKSSLK
ncbi:hypothetical protein HID58_064229, partial [Brassica napus]